MNMDRRSREVAARFGVALAVALLVLLAHFLGGS
jgi:hypothetical protein